MKSDIIGIVIIIIIWIINGKNIIQGLKGKIIGEVYHHAGIGLFFTLIAVEFFFEISGLFFCFNILWIKMIGYLLFIPSALFVFGSIYQLKIKGKAGSLSPHGTNHLVKTGIFGIIRHPMWMGFSIWSFALILCYQSLFSFIIGLIAITCFRIASIKEDDQELIIFGDDYRKYIEKVPRWNLFKNLMHK